MGYVSGVQRVSPPSKFYLTFRWISCLGKLKTSLVILKISLKNPFKWPVSFILARNPILISSILKKSKLVFWNLPTWHIIQCIVAKHDFAAKWYMPNQLRGLSRSNKCCPIRFRKTGPWTSTICAWSSWQPKFGVWFRCGEHAYRNVSWSWW